MSEAASELKLTDRELKFSQISQEFATGAHKLKRFQDEGKLTRDGTDKPTEAASKFDRAEIAQIFLNQRGAFRVFEMENLSNLVSFLNRTGEQFSMDSPEKSAEDYYRW